MPPPRRRAFKHFLTGAVALVALGGASCSGPTHPPATPLRVVVITLDGMRPDAITQATTPALMQLAKEGAATLKAQTVLPSLTLPAHTSMMTGLVPARHHIDWNDDTTGHTERVTVSTIFDIATAAGYTSAMFVGKSKLLPIVKPGSPTKVNMPGTGEIWKADTVAAHVRAYLASVNDETKPNMMFIHFPDVDIAGHTTSWMSPTYMAAVRHTDSVFAQVWLDLRQTFGTDLVIIVTADHGGVGTGHSDGSQLATTVPWIIWGKGIRQQVLTVDVRTVDVGPTMLWLLGVTPPSDWDGVPVKSAFPALVH